MPYSSSDDDNDNDNVDDTGEQHHQQQQNLQDTIGNMNYHDYDGVYDGTDDDSNSDSDCDCDDENPTAIATTTTSNNNLLNEKITTTTVNTLIDYLVDNEDDNYEDLRGGDSNSISNSNSDCDCDYDDENPAAAATTATSNSNSNLFNKTTTATNVDTLIDYLVDNEDDNYYEDLRDGDDSNSDCDCDDKNPAATITTANFNALIDYLVDNQDDDNYEDLRDADFDDRIDNSIGVLNAIAEEESQNDQTNTPQPPLYDNNHNNKNDDDNNNNDNDCISKIDNLMEQFESDLLELKSDMSIQFNTTTNNNITTAEELESITVPLSNISSVVTTTAPTSPKLTSTSTSTSTEYTTICETPTRTIAINKGEDDLNKEQYTIEYTPQADKYQYEATTNLAKDHSENYAIQNQDTSSLASDYVTWMDTLHPENADITIDQQLFILRIPCWMIHYEQSKNHQIPTVTAVRVTGEKVEERMCDDSQQQQTNDEENDNGSPLYNKFDASFWKTCPPLDVIVGHSICLPTILIALTFEIIALCIFYFLSAIFFHAATRTISSPTYYPEIWYAMLLLLFSIFSFLDSVLLLVGVVVTESLAIIASILGFMYGGIMWSQYLHQHIRQSCHGVRIVFRKNKKNTPRQIFFVMNCLETAINEKENENEDADDDAITSVNINRTRENKTTKKAMIHTNITCTPDTVVSSSSLCFSTASSSCHVDVDVSGSGGGGGGSGVSPVCPRVLKFYDDNDNDDKENEIFEEAMCFSTTSSSCYVDDDVSGSGGGGDIVSPVCPRVLNFDDDNDNDDEEKSAFEEAIISPIKFILLVILMPFMYNRSSSLYGFKNSINSLSNRNSNSDNGMFVTKSIPSSITAGASAVASATFGSSIVNMVNDNTGTTTPIKFIMTPLIQNTATTTTFFIDEEMNLEKKDTKIITPALTKKKIDMDMAVIEDNNKIPATKTSILNTNRNNNNTNSIAEAEAATTQLFIADTDAATASTTSAITVPATVTNVTTLNNRNSNTSKEQIRTQKQVDDNVIALTTDDDDDDDDTPPIVTPPNLKSKPKTSASSKLLVNDVSVDHTVMTIKTTTATAVATTTTDRNNKTKKKQKQKNNEVVEDTVVGADDESITSTADVVIAGISPSALRISKLVSTSETNGVNINNNNNNYNYNTTDNVNNKKSNDLGVVTDSNTNINHTAVARVQVGKVQFSPERQLRKIFNRGKQMLQQLCHYVRKHRECRIRERNSFQQQYGNVNNNNSQP